MINNLEDFLKWYSEAGKLGIFWAKPLKEYEIISSEKEYHLIKIKWDVKRRNNDEAVIVIICGSVSMEKLLNKARKHTKENIIAILGEESKNYNNIYKFNPSAESILYIWRVDNWRESEVNKDVVITNNTSWDEDVFREIHRKSWGFYIPPRKEDHIILLAYLDEKPIGIAYLNKNNFNIDYGIHVKREFWRRRIGSRILKECINISKEHGAEYMSVIRVLRRVGGGRADDKRAISFYKRNNPEKMLRIFRLLV